MNYVKLLKQELGTCINLKTYIPEAIRYAKTPHYLVSSINRNNWLYFNHFDIFTQKWGHYVATLNEDATKFDVYKIYGGIEKQEKAQVSVPDVLSKKSMKKFGFPIKKGNSVSKPKAKVNTHKSTKKSTKAASKHKSKKRVSKKGSKAHKINKK